MVGAEALVAEMRSVLRSALPEKAFLRRDRGERLFISNAPVFAPEIGGIDGFLLENDGKMLRILPDAGWIERLEDMDAPDFFCETALRFRGLKPDRENLLLFALGAKILDAGSSASAEDKAAFDRALRQSLAAALRGGCGGGLYAAAILNCEIQSL